MSLLARKSDQFLRDYIQRKDDWQEAAKRARGLVEEIVNHSGLAIHGVTARAKGVASLRRKLHKKRYGDPSTDLTDVIGVRVITYYQDDVDRLVGCLKREFSIDAAKSADKRASLSLHEFGYRSVHLIARLDRRRKKQPEYSGLAGKCFEIQVRSILEHAWAEIEHAVIYEGSVQYPDDVRRRFAAIAGTLETLDDQFLRLREERDRVILELRERYESGKDMARKLDAGRLIAFFDARFPEGLGWRKAHESGKPFAPGLEQSCVEALAAVGICTARGLTGQLADRGFRRRLQSFASEKGLTPAEVSHPALVVLAVGMQDASLLRDYFPEMTDDPGLAAALPRR